MTTGVEATREPDLGCMHCANERPFDMPEPIVRACVNGDLVVFAGAGVSTEQSMAAPISLYDEVRAECGIPKESNLAFQALMTTYEERYGRIALLERVKKHLDYFRSFPNLDGQAAAFARELSSLFPVTEIVTTNWDDYFERECGAQPFVTEQDWAFWKSSERKVFKLHGSISNPGSIIATEADYEKCYRELTEGLVGGELKRMLATKTIVFVGYSLGDPDFTAVYQLMKRRMGDLLPRSYVVTIDDREPSEVARDMDIIRTSGEHFLHRLKAEYPGECLLPDDRFNAIPLIRAFTSEMHHDLMGRGEMGKDPAMLICACYQDGLLDAFDHQMANRAAGKYSHRCDTRSLVEHYAGLQEEREKDGVWHTAAYIEGYMNGLVFLIADDDDRERMPFYFVFGSDQDLRTFDEYAKAAPKFELSHPEAYAYARRFAARLKPGIVFHHIPVL